MSAPAAQRFLDAHPNAGKGLPPLVTVDEISQFYYSNDIVVSELISGIITIIITFICIAQSG